VVINLRNVPEELFRDVHLHREMERYVTGDVRLSLQNFVVTLLKEALESRKNAKRKTKRA
jgi:hypothetical protein